MTTPRSRALAVLALAGSLFLGACGGDDEDAGPPPEEVLAAAKTNLDETPGVHLVLSTDKLPPQVSGILRAEGVGTHAPAFEGTLKVVASGITADADVVAVDDLVYAKLPFTTDFTEIDPADYAAPDPADLMSPEGGLSSLLTSAENVEEGEDIRAGELVVTEYTGTVPGNVVAGIIPTASADGGFDARFTVTEENVLNEAVLSGPFYPGAADVTYTIEFDEYGIEKEITAP
jgi:lipoprotein LprG